MPFVWKLQLDLYVYTWYTRSTWYMHSGLIEIKLQTLNMHEPREQKDLAK